MTEYDPHILIRLNDELNAYNRERSMLLADPEIASIIGTRIEQRRWIINADGFITKNNINSVL